jgi:hypothetical protein
MTDTSAASIPIDYAFWLMLWIFTSISAAIAAILLEYRNKGGWGWLCLCGALSLLCVSVYFIYPPLVRYGLSDNAKILQDQLTLANEALKTEREVKIDLERRLAANVVTAKVDKEREQSLFSRVMDLKLALEAKQYRIVSVEKQTAALVSELNDKVRKIDALTRESSRLQADYAQELDGLRRAKKQLEEALNSQAEKNRLVEQRKTAFQRELESARSAQAKVKIEEPTGQQSQTIIKSVKSDHFSIVPLETNELIKGQFGHYFSINFLSQNGSHFEFLPGKFILERTEDVKSAASEFNVQVLIPLRAIGPAQVYTRGRADAMPINATIGASGDKFGRLSIRKMIARELYAAAPSELLITNRFYNSDLPNLRAAFFNSTFQNVGISGIETLEGMIVEDHVPNSHGVDVFLYIP